LGIIEWRRSSYIMAAEHGCYFIVLPPAPAFHEAPDYLHLTIPVALSLSIRYSYLSSFEAFWLRLRAT
jgi:hypothetical protein